VAEIAKLASVGWANLPEEEKQVRKFLIRFNLIYIDHLIPKIQVYKDRYKANSSDYKERYDKWLSKLTPKEIFQENERRKLESEFKKKKVKLIKNPKSLPTPPKTPYIFFAMKRMNEGRSERVGIKKLEELVFEWNKLTSEDKKVM
jgi:hypothetical protein